MSYTKQIFNEMKAIDPNITVREFSCQIASNYDPVFALNFDEGAQP